MPANGLPNIKNLMGLAKTAPSERPLSEEAKKLRELVGRMDVEVQKLKSFNPEQSIRENFEKLENEVNESADADVKHINEIRSDLLSQINQHRQECLNSLLERSSIKVEDTEEPPAKKIARLSTQLHATADPSSQLQQEFEQLSREMSDFVLKWKDYFQKADSYASDKEIAAALCQVQAGLKEIEKHGEASKLEATNGRTIQFQANNLFLQTRDHLGKLSAVPIEQINDREPSKGENNYARRDF